MRVFGYPQPGKWKSTEILQDFVAGAGGDGQLCVNRELWAGIAAAFYGTVGIEGLFRAAQTRARDRAGDFYYVDNAYFDAGRGRYFRISRNALQRSSVALMDYAQLIQLGIRVKPWRTGGAHVLVIEQSDYFMREICGWKGGLGAWRSSAIATLSAHTDREIRVRAWSRDKTALAQTLGEDLAGAHAVVTHSSAAAVAAILEGIPVFATGETALEQFANRDLAQIEAPVRPDDSREEWAARLAGSQWTREQMRSGQAWRALQAEMEMAA